jgi:AcrR family transcriptional regulator
MELKERIIRQASVLFFTKGVKSMTMADVANDLGISKRTLYEVFHDKEELLESCIQHQLEKGDREIREMIANSENVIDTLMRVYAKNLREVQGTSRSVLHDLKKYYAPVYHKIECRQKAGFATFDPLLKKGIEEGLIREDVNFEILTWLLKAQFKALLYDEIMPTDKYPIEEFVRVIILNFIRGIATQAGNEKVDKIVTELNQ